MRKSILTAVVLFSAACTIQNPLQEVRRSPMLSELSSLGDSAVLVPAPGQSGDLFPNQEAMARGQTAFASRDYGKAMMEFKTAIDLAPADPNAWLGMAASADFLGQFDVSDYAYSRLERAIGDRAEFLNNYGYSQMLRGNLVRAREIFDKALLADPNNKTTINNIAMLNYIVDSQINGKSS